MDLSLSLGSFLENMSYEACEESFARNRCSNKWRLWRWVQEVAVLEMKTENSMLQSLIVLDVKQPARSSVLSFYPPRSLLVCFWTARATWCGQDIVLVAHRKGARGKEDETSYSYPSYVFLLAGWHISIMGEVVENQDIPRRQLPEGNSWRLDINKYKPTRPEASQNPKAHSGCLNQRFGKSCYMPSYLLLS